ncbi:MAG: type ISP restriction/modification enzyme [Rhodanobacter sp.]
MADGRLLSRPRQQLWHSLSTKQLFFASLLTKPLGNGPGLSASASIPDMDHFSGRGAKDIIPLYRDSKATQPNLHPQLLPLLSRILARMVSAENFSAYQYALLAQPAFTARFHKELATRELRVPLTIDATLFQRAVTLGRELLFLHSYGERFTDQQHWPQPVVKNIKSVPGGQLPEEFGYDEARQIINVGGGEFGPVPLAVWNYEVSGLKVVQSWLGYRMKIRKGKKSSPLDDIAPHEWGSEYNSELVRLLNLLTRTVELQPAQAALLDAILAGPLFNTAALGPVPPQWRKPSKVTSAQHGLDV